MEASKAGQDRYSKISIIYIINIIQKLNIFMKNTVVNVSNFL